VWRRTVEKREAQYDMPTTLAARTAPAKAYFAGAGCAGAG
jgi:hypothetical protein